LCFFVLFLMVCAKEGKISSRLWGVNIHYTKGRPGESNQLSQAYRIARMDFAWGGIERVKNQYDFTQYEQLWSELKEQSIPVACYWILDYGNPLYDGGASPYTKDAIQAFVNFAVASLKKFAGRGIIWEMWNEPNGNFWNPHANSTAYSILANAVGAAIRGNSEIQNEIYVGPATSGIDLTYLEQTFQHGVLDYFDAVSVHPYRSGAPESVLPEYNNLRNLIKKYAPNGKELPILSGEWGWTTCVSPCTPGFTSDRLSLISDDVQGKFLARQWLLNSLADVPISIYYDFMDDGPDPKYAEQNFGTLRFQYYNQSVPHIPKPAYRAALLLQKILADLQSLRRVDSSDSYSFVLAFGKDSNVDEVYAVWKAGGPPVGTCESVTAPVDCGFFWNQPAAVS